VNTAAHPSPAWFISADMRLCRAEVPAARDGRQTRDDCEESPTGSIRRAQRLRSASAIGTTSVTATDYRERAQRVDRTSCVLNSSTRSSLVVKPYCHVDRWPIRMVRAARITADPTAVKNEQYSYQREFGRGVHAPAPCDGRESWTCMDAFAHGHALNYDDHNSFIVALYYDV
jgi:hypothetical protein